MKFVEHDGNFQIAPNDVVSYSELPAGYYKINYDEKHDIFSLGRTYNFEIAEKNYYGNDKRKIQKVINTFNLSNKSLGVLLTGYKGTGKSLFAKLLCMGLYSQGKAIIIVDKSYKGLDRFISDIPGDNIVFLFDEFEKTFNRYNDSDGRDETTQSSLLTVFDGTGMRKRMYIVSSNDMSDLDHNILNRPGRFHYHFEFSFPSPDDIKAYMKDNLNTYNESEVNKIIDLSARITVTYDILRSICFEMNMGYKYEDFIYDLNIKFAENDKNSVFTFTDTDGYKIKLWQSYDYDDDTNINSNDSMARVHLSNKPGGYYTSYVLCFKKSDIVYGADYSTVEKYTISSYDKDTDTDKIDTSKPLIITKSNPLLYPRTFFM